ncbi:MAG: hypothetical protein Kilf2KO_24310 [Rhodospirillales bacterium]
MNRLHVDGSDPKVLKVQRRQLVTLVMLSGGIDSVYTLVKLLRETDDTILAHHIDLVNDEGRWVPERTACRNVVDFCREAYRDFSYSESAIDHRGLAFFGFDMVSVGFEAGIVSHSYYNATQRMPDRWTVGSCTEEGSNPGRFKHVEACVAANCFPVDPPVSYSLPIVSKKEEMSYLDIDLLRRLWTCRRPIEVEDGYRECGLCKTCELVAHARDA